MIMLISFPMRWLPITITGKPMSSTLMMTRVSFMRIPDSARSRCLGPGYILIRRVGCSTGSLHCQLNLESLNGLLQHTNFAFFYILKNAVQAQGISCCAFLFRACRRDRHGDGSAHGQKSAYEKWQTNGILKWS